MPADKSHRTFFIILTAFFFAHLLFFDQLRLLPFSDYLNHLSEATIYRYSGQPDNDFHLYYPYRLFPYANVFHILFMGSPFFPSVEFGGKLFVSLYMVLLPLSIFLLIRRLGGDIWFTFLSFLYLYNRSFYWGFLPFAFSIPIFFLLFLAILISLEKRNILWDVTVALLMVFLYTIHFMTAVYAVLIYVAVVLTACRRNPSSLFRRTLVMAPLLILLVVAGLTKGDPGLMKFLGEYYTADFGPSWAWRVKELLVFDNKFLSVDTLGDNIGLFFSLGVIGALVFRGLVARRMPPDPALRRARRIIWPLLAGPLVCFFLLPPHVQRHGNEYQRFSTFFFLGLVIYGSLFVRTSPKTFRYGLCGFAFLNFVLWGRCLVMFENANQGFNREFFADINPRATLGALIYEAYYGHFPAYRHFPNYYIIWHKGIAATNLTIYRYYIFDGIDPARRTPCLDEHVELRDSLKQPHLNADYLLVRGRVPERHESQLSQGFDKVRRSGPWILLKRAGP